MANSARGKPGKNSLILEGKSVFVVDDGGYVERVEMARQYRYLCLTKDVCIFLS